MRRAEKTAFLFIKRRQVGRFSSPTRSASKNEKPASLLLYKRRNFLKTGNAKFSSFFYRFYFSRFVAFSGGALRTARWDV